MPTVSHPRSRPRPVGALVVSAVVAVAAALALIALTTAPAAAATTCTQDWQPAATPAYLTADGAPTSPPVPLPAPRTPQYRAFHVFCGGHYVNTVWRAPTNGPIDASVAANEVVAKALYPTVRPAVNPTTGITGLASWFWATTDDTPVHMLPGNGPGVDIELRVDTVRWRFGDGTTTTVKGVGVPYPAPSPVTHVFERTGTVTVEARVALIGHLRDVELDVEVAGSHTVTLRHDIVQVRSLLHTE